MNAPKTPDGIPPEVPSYTLMHLSDTHLTAPNVRYHGTIDADAALRKAVREIQRATRNGYIFDGIIVSGDLTDGGHPDAYRRLRRMLEPLNTPIIWCNGNHDVRATLHDELLSEATDDGLDADEPRLQFHWLGEDLGLRVIVLDSAITGAGHGYLDPRLPSALATVLSTPAPGGTIVVLHHSPLPAPSPLLTYFALDSKSRQILSDSVAGADVRMILTGHHHLAQTGMLGSVPVITAGSTAIRTDPLAPAGHERTLASASMNFIQIYEDTFTSSVIPLDDAELVFDLGPTECAEIISKYPI